MKIQDLQQPYRALAEMRREQQINSEWVKKCEKYFKETNELHLAFYWENTPEGGDWWKDLNEGNTPEITAESLAELKEWQKGKQCFDCKGDIDKDGQCFCNKEFEAVLIAEQPKENPFSGYEDKLFTAAVAAMQGMIVDSSVNEITAAFILEKLELPKDTPYNFLEHYPKYISLVSWNMAESLINEGKKRGHLQLKTRG